MENTSSSSWAERQKQQFDEKAEKKIDIEEKPEKNSDIDEKSELNSDILETSEKNSENEEKSEINSHIEENSKINSDIEENLEINSDNEEISEKNSDIEEKSEIKSDIEEKSEINSDIEEKSEKNSNVQEKSEINSDIDAKSELNSDILETSKKNSDNEEKSEINSHIQETSKINFDIEENPEINSDIDEKSEKMSDIEEKSEKYSDIKEKSEINSDIEEESEIITNIEEKLEKKSDIGEKPEINSVKEESEKKSDVEEKSEINSDIEEKAEKNSVIEEKPEKKFDIEGKPEKNSDIEEKTEKYSDVKEKPEKKYDIEKNEAEEETTNDRAYTLSRSIDVYFGEYCANSSLHGVRYLGERGRTIIEKIWWLLVFIASIWICVQLIMNTWDKWDESPVLVTFAQSPNKIWEVPFPAVTICSETKARKEIYNFTEAYYKYHSSGYGENMSFEEWKNFQDISLLCDTYLLSEGMNTTDKSALKFIHEVAPQFDEMMWLCKWSNIFNATCEDIFHPILTEEGLCYTFNMLDSSELLFPEVQDENYLNHGEKSDWDLYEGYKEGSGINVYPRRVIEAGLHNGLTILLRTYDYDLDYICRGPVQGFKVILHNPAEIPRTSEVYFRVPLNQEVLAAVQPNMMTTSESFISRHPFRRHCFFQNEKKLRFYKIYTQQNCEIECLANSTLSACGCVKFYMPQRNNTPICGPGSNDCTTRKLLKMLLRKIGSKLSKKNTKINKENLEKCNCLPSCTSLSYSVETSQADFNWEKMFAAYNVDLNELPGIQISRLHIFFKKTEFISSIRSELFGSTDFLSSCGGLLGIFMGFSFLSVVEIVYYLTLRMWCNIIMHGRKMWNDSKMKQINLF